jgi:hypothetical protein
MIVIAYQVKDSNNEWNSYSTNDRIHNARAVFRCFINIYDSILLGSRYHRKDPYWFSVYMSFTSNAIVLQ